MIFFPSQKEKDDKWKRSNESERKLEPIIFEKVKMVRWGGKSWSSSGDIPEAEQRDSSLLWEHFSGLSHTLGALSHRWWELVLLCSPDTEQMCRLESSYSLLIFPAPAAASP